MTRCSHCGQALEADATTDFCCVGCHVAYEFLDAEGWSRFYELRGPDGRAGSGGDLGEAAPAWLIEAVAGREELTLSIGGMHCAACAWVVERIAKRAGALSCVVSVAKGRATLRFQSLDVGAFAAPLARLGYLIAPLGTRTRPRVLSARLGITAALAMNAMVLAAARYLGLEGEQGRLFDLLSAGLMVVALVVGGGVFAKRAWHGLRAGQVSMDVPITLGLALAALGSLATLRWPALEVAYFDTVTVFLALVLFGRWTQARVVERGRALTVDTPGLETTQLRTREGIKAAASVVVGDHILLAPGEVCLLRALLVTERASLSYEWITGEPEPRAGVKGDELVAGARNRGSTFVEVEALEPISASSLGALFAVEEPDTENALGGPAVALVIRYYALFVVVLALAGFALWVRTDAGAALQVAIALLVVTCPCALGLALPMAYDLAASESRRAGLFVRRLDVYDRLAGVRRVALDKTGTLTAIELQVREPGVSSLDETCAGVLRALSEASNHPRSRALAALLQARPKTPVDSMEERAGEGVRAIALGVEWRLGRASFATDGEDDGSAVLSRAGVAVARFHFSERARPGAQIETAALLAAGYDVEVLSGDVPARVTAFAQELGLSRARGGLRPEDKAALVDDGHTLFIGDGLNDGLALDAALVAGSPGLDVPTVPGRCDFVVTSRRFADLASLFDLAKRVRRASTRALVLALVYNAIVIALSLAGLMAPLMAAVLMPLSSIVVVIVTRATVRGSRALARPALVLAPA